MDRFFRYATFSFIFFVYLVGGLALLNHYFGIGNAVSLTMIGYDSVVSIFGLLIGIYTYATIINANKWKKLSGLSALVLAFGYLAIFLLCPLAAVEPITVVAVFFSSVAFGLYNSKLIHLEDVAEAEAKAKKDAKAKPPVVVAKA